MAQQETSVPTGPETARGSPDSDMGGDPVCWIDQVCDTCGGFIGRGHDHTCRTSLPLLPGSARGAEAGPGTDTAPGAGTAPG